MSGLTIKNGQFYRDGKVVPPVFGDLEQIAVLKAHEAEAEEAKENGIPVEYEEEEYTRMEVKIRFKCINCSNMLRDHIDGEDEEYYSEDDFVGNVYTCKKCFTKYEVKQEDLGSYLVARKME